MSPAARPVCVVGAGHAGSACMLGLSQLGWRVHGCDVVPGRLERLESGSSRRPSSWIVEALRDHCAAGRLRLFGQIGTAAANAAVVIIGVETHVRTDGSTDISELEAAIRALAEVDFLTWPTIVIRSTVSPGTSDRLADLVSDWADLLYAPALRSDGCALSEFLNPDRIVVGCELDSQCVPYMNLLQEVQRPIFITARRNVELIQCCASAYWALNASFASEVANLCEGFGATSDDVLRGVEYTHRRGEKFLRPGMTMDSPSFDRDVRRLKNAAAQRGIKQELISATLRVSEEQPLAIVARLESAIGSIAGTSIGVWGVTAAASIDDPREALAYRVIELLSEREAKTIVYDPSLQLASLPRGCRLATSALEAARADALVVLSACADFYGIDPASYASTIVRSVVVDAGNILDPDRVEANGMLYHGVGRSRNAGYDRPLTAWRKGTFL